MSPREKIGRFYTSRKRMPSYAELMKILGYKTKSAVDYAVKKLIKEGALSKDNTGKLLPKSLFDDIRLLGVVEAGFPTAAEEELLDTMSLDDYLIKNKEATFMLKVKGESMIDAGIMEGDMVLVERGKTPKSGQIVIAQIDGEFTMKYFIKRGTEVWLEPANKAFKSIHPKNNLKIEAIVTAVIRRY